jgi:hypothetical protein
MPEEANATIEGLQKESTPLQNSLQAIIEDAVGTLPPLTLPEPSLPLEAETEATLERGRTLIRDVEYAALRGRKSSGEAGARCGICHEPLNNRAQIKPCDHLFDLECISTWLAQSRPASQTCPLCRSVMTEIHHFDDQGGILVQNIDFDLTRVTPRQRHAAREQDRVTDWILYLRDTVPYVERASVSSCMYVTMYVLNLIFLHSLYRR